MEKPSAYRGDDPFVFVCYAHEDAESVYPEITWLQAQGVNVWYDEGISLGTEWTQALADAIQGCTRFLFFVTPNSVAREHCRRELNFAQEEGRDVLAVHLQPAEVPGGLRLSLNNRQAIFKHEMADKQYRGEVLQALLGPPAEPAAAPTPPSSPTRGPRLAVYGVAALLIAVVGAWWLNVAEQEAVEPEAVTQAEPIDPSEPDLLSNSIAVLPFENLSPDLDNAYFAAGMHVEILNQLAKVQDLSVIARETMVRYANSDKSIPMIGSELNVGTVMSGSVRYAGDRVRIATQLVDATSGTQLWSEAYEENLEDVFGIQLSIATRIADTLAVELSSDERKRIASPLTDNSDAYVHYLRALSSFGGLDPLGPSHEALNEAIKLDGNFAAALAFKALLHTFEQYLRYLGPAANREAHEQSITLAHELARRSLAVDETQARAHYAMSVVHLHNRNWPAMSHSLDQAYANNPSDYIAVSGAAIASFNSGDVDEAIRLLRRSIELNPDVANIWNFGELLYWAQRWQDAKQQAQVVIANAGEAAFGYSLLAKVNAHIGDVEGVRQYAALAESRNPGLYELVDIALAYQRIDDLDSARRIFDLAGAGDVSTIPNPDWQFWMSMAVEDYDAAVIFLERVVEDNFPITAAALLHRYADHPDYDAIRSHPTFDVLVEAVSWPLQGDDAI